MTRRSRVVPAALALVVLLASAAADGSAQWRLVGNDTAQGDELGFAVGVDGDAIVVGAPYDDSPSGFRSGKAYVFVRSGNAWAEQQDLVALDRSANAQFGTSADVDGDTVIVGAPEESQLGAGAGAAYVYHRAGTRWSQQQKLLAPDAQPGAHFGEFVAVDGDTAVVGARLQDVAGVDSGAAYVFVRTGETWSHQATLVPDDAAVGDHFGISVAVDGDVVAVGAPFGGPLRSGAAYVFARTGTAWTQERKIVQADVLDQGFGYDVDLSGDTLLVGAPDRDGGTVDPGAAYVFVRSGGAWPLEQRIQHADPGPHDRFGRCVAVSGDLALIASPLDDDRGENAGAAYVFRRTDGVWAQHRKVVGIDVAEGDKFGLWVALDGTTGVVGAPLHDSPVEDAGSAYVVDVLRADGPPDVPPEEPQEPVVVDAYLLPKKVVASRSALIVTGTLDTGSAAADLAGPAQMDVGTLNLAFPNLVRRGRNLTATSGGSRLTLGPSPTGSSRTTFTLRHLGDVAARVPSEGAVTLRFRGAEADAGAVLGLARGKFALGRSAATIHAPSGFVLAANAALIGAGRDTLALTVGFAGTGAAPAATPDVRVVFGSLDVTIPGASFVRRGDVLTFAGDQGGVTRAVLDFRRGTLTVKARGATLGEFASGANVVPVRFVIGAADRTVRVRMARAGSRLRY